MDSDPASLEALLQVSAVQNGIQMIKAGWLRFKSPVLPNLPFAARGSRPHSGKHFRICEEGIKINRIYMKTFQSVLRNYGVCA